MNQLLDVCDTWDLTLSTDDTLHSKLYALEPLGIGTSDIESLTSYMARLAGAHSVSLRTLAIQETLPLLKCDYLSNPRGNSLEAFWLEATRALNGTGSLAKDWVHALECLTLRTDLRFLTLLPWAAVLTQQRLLRSTRSWCPDCFMEWQAAGLPIYEPLIWNMSAVSVCVHHQRPLMAQCPHPDCQAILPVLASHFRPGYCSKCLRWLGVVPDHPAPSLITEQWHWQIWVAEAVGKLVAQNMNSTLMPHLGNIPDLVSAAREQTADGSMQNLAEKLQLSRRTLNAWLLGRQVPQLESIMRLCYFCGVSPYDLLSAQPGELSFDELDVHSLPNIPNPAKNRRNRIRFDTVHLRQKLDAVLVCEEKPLPSMRVVAKRLNHSPRELREHFPELCRAISNRRKSFYKNRSEEKLEQQKEQIRQAVLEIHSQGEYPNWHRVDLVLNESGMMRNPILGKIWRDMLQELNLTD